MIKANELRIGNLIMWNDSEVIVDAHKIYMLREGRHNYRGKPIPLTEDWLIRFGFRGNSDWHYYHNASNNEERPLKITINLKDSNFYVALWDEDQEVVLVDKPAYYVHSLQNLFFALTQTELTPTP